MWPGVWPGGHEERSIFELQATHGQKSITDLMSCHHHTVAFVWRISMQDNTIVLNVVTRSYGLTVDVTKKTHQMNGPCETLRHFPKANGVL